MTTLHARATDGFISMLCSLAEEGCEDTACVCYCHKTDIASSGEPMVVPAPDQERGPTATQNTIKIELYEDINQKWGRNSTLNDVCQFCKDPWCRQRNYCVFGL